MEVGNEVIKRTRRERDASWLSDKTKAIAEEVREARMVLEIKKGSQNTDEESSALKSSRKRLRESLKEDHEKFWNKEEAVLEEAARKNDTRLMFAKQRKLCKIENTKLIDLRPVLSANGSELIREPDRILQRWAEHYSTRLNRGAPKDAPSKISRPLREIEEKIAAPVERAEVEKAVKQMKNGKAAGIDLIQAEVYKYGGTTAIDWLWRVISAVWSKEEVPEDRKKMIIIPLHKG